jgi:hypothetical protein
MIESGSFVMQHQVYLDGQFRPVSQASSAPVMASSLKRTDLFHEWHLRSVENQFSRHPAVATSCEQDLQSRRVLGQSLEAQLGELELLLDHAEGMLGLGTNAAGLRRLDFVNQLLACAVLVQRAPLARTPGYVPINFKVLGFISFGHTLISSIPENIGFMAMKKASALRQVVDIGGGGDDCVQQARRVVHTHVGLNANVLLVTFPCLTRLWVAYAAAFLRRTWGWNQRRIRQGFRLEHRALRCQARVHRLQKLRRQFVLLQQFSKAQDRERVRYPARARHARKLPIQRPLVVLLFHRRIAQVPPQLQAADADGRFNRKRRATTESLISAVRMRRNQRGQFGLCHHYVHLIKENLLAGLLEQPVSKRSAVCSITRILPLVTHRTSRGATGFAYRP